MKFLFPFRRSKSDCEKPTQVTMVNSPVASSLTNQSLSNEANVIAYVRSLVPQLKALGIQNRRNHLLQWEEYINDIDAPAKPSRFTELDESNKQLREEYESITEEINLQIRIYDRYCEQHQLNYSPQWNQLLADLKWYLGGISSAGAYHLKEAVEGFVKPTQKGDSKN